MKRFRTPPGAGTSPTVATEPNFSVMKKIKTQPPPGRAGASLVAAGASLICAGAGKCNDFKPILFLEIGVYRFYTSSSYQGWNFTDLISPAAPGGSWSIPDCRRKKPIFFFKCHQRTPAPVCKKTLATPFYSGHTQEIKNVSIQMISPNANRIRCCKSFPRYVISQPSFIWLTDLIFIFSFGTVVNILKSYKISSISDFFQRQGSEVKSLQPTNISSFHLR